MPLRHSLLRLEVPALQSVDTSRVEDLFQMWSLFSKAAHAVEDGKRLENLSWRLWNRETFCCHRKSQAHSADSTPTPFRNPKAAATDIPVPELSSSLSSTSTADDLEEVERAPSRTITTDIPTARPELRCADRGYEKHITPTDLEKFVISIQQSKDLEQKPIELPISTPAIYPKELSSMSAAQHLSNLTLDETEPIEPQTSESTARPCPVPESRSNPLESSASTFGTNEEKDSQTCGSQGSSHTEMSTHSIIRGFVAGGAPSSYRSQTSLTVQPTPILKTLPHKQEGRHAKKGAMFTIGTSSGEDESSLESHMFKSALSESLRRPGSTLSGSGSRKQTSFKEEVAIGRAAEHSPVFESDDEDEEVSESAIDDDDDDSSDWEDSEDQSDHSSVNEKEMFQRVDSRPDLTSRRSLLTTLMHEPDRAKALANAASRSSPAMRRSRNTSPNGPSVATSPTQSGTDAAASHQDGAHAKPIIVTTSNTNPVQLALSPRSTRRNMLSTELTESLRKNLLWERQHKSTGNLAALRRRHTSNDVRNLRQQPEPAPVLSHQDGSRNFTNDYFHAGLQEFHAKGW